MADEQYKQQLRDKIAAMEAQVAAMGVPSPTATPEAVMTPIAAPELSWWDKLKAGADAQPTKVVGMFGATTPQDYAKSWSFDSLRKYPEEAASIGGSIIGGSAGLVLGGAPGAVLGSALGSYADVPVQAAFDYASGADIPVSARVGEASKEAALGALIEGGLRVTGWAGKAASPFAKKAYSTIADYFGPQSAETAQRLVGSEITNLVPEEELRKAVANKEILSRMGMPASNLTVADMTGNQQAAMAEKLMSRQPVAQANMTFANNARNQLEEINNTAKSLVDIQDPNPKRAGEAAKTLLEKARESQNNAAGSLFTDEVRQIKAPIKGIAGEVDSVQKSIFKDSEVLGPGDQVQGLMEQIKGLEQAPAAEKAPVGFGRKAPEKKPAPVESTVGTLQDLRSKALEIARGATTGSRDELVAERLVDVLGKRIDAVEGTESLVEARDQWRKFKQTWYREEDGQLSPLAKLLRKQNPEDIISAVSKKSAVSDAYQEAVGKIVGGIEPNKLATEMADFANQSTVDAKLNWIRNKRAVYADSPIWPVVQGWENTLKRIQTKGELSDIANLSAENINTEAKSLIRALGGVANETFASTGERSGVSAARNVARSAVTSAAGGSLGTKFLASLPVMSSLFEKSTTETASALTQALADPAIAVKYMDDAAKYGEEVAAKEALRRQKFEQFTPTLEKVPAAGGALARGLGIFDAKPSATPTPMAESLPTPSVDQVRAELESIRAEIAKKKEAAVSTPVAAPTPSEETIKVGKQNVSIPSGEGFAPANIVKAIIQVESGGNPSAVSSKGATGLMQLMPKTARALGVDPTDPQDNVNGGSRYIQQMLAKYGKPDLALAAYNWGEGNLDKAIKILKAENKRVTWHNLMQAVRVPMETRMYVNKVMKLA